MRTRSMLRALVAVTALAGAAVPAAADPVDFTLATPALCAPPSVVAACVPDLASARTVAPSSSAGRAYSVTCTDGGRNVVTATVQAAPHGAAGVTRVKGTCTLMSNGAGYVAVTADGPGPVETASRSGFGTPAGPLSWCVAVQAWWADGFTEAYADAGPHCFHDEG